jgi:hypothetical protein
MVTDTLEANMASTLSPAATSLGLGNVLAEQVKDETEEQRRRRLLLELQKATIMPGVPVGFGPLAGGRRI